VSQQSGLVHHPFMFGLLVLCLNKVGLVHHHFMFGLLVLHHFIETQHKQPKHEVMMY
jgi:hypothetical protein